MAAQWEELIVPPPINMAWIHAPTRTRGFHDFTEGNPCVGWQWGIAIDRHSQHFSGPVFTRKSDAREDCMQVCRVLAKALRVKRKA